MPDTGAEPTGRSVQDAVSSINKTRLQTSNQGKGPKLDSGLTVLLWKTASSPHAMTSSLRTNLTLRLLQKQKRLSHNAKRLHPGGAVGVAAIVGILSAVFLPNFLSQTDKAKATEAKTHIASTLKQAHAKFLEDGATPESTITNMNSNYGTPTDDTTKFNYEQVSWSSPVWTIKAVGNSTDQALKTKNLMAASIQYRHCRYSIPT